MSEDVPETGRQRNILVVSPTGAQSGAESVLLRLVARARRDGWNVEVATPEGPLAEAVRALSVTHHAIPELKLPSGPKAVGCLAVGLRSLKAALLLRRAARGADLVVVNGLFTLPAVRLARLRRPVVWLVHDVIARRDWLLLLRLVSAGVTMAVAPSEASAAPLREAGMAVRVIRNGTLWPLPTLGASGDERRPEPVIGSMAALTPLKGQDVLLEAVARMRHRDAVLELAGEGFAKDLPYVGRLRTRAREPDLHGRVAFLGLVEDPLAVMARWRVAVLASVYPEAAPLVVLEAMSLGVPQVVTDEGGAPEVLANAGIVVESSDPDALAAAIDRLLDDAALHGRLSATGPRIIARGLSLEKQLQNLMVLLGEVCAIPDGHRRTETVFAVPDYKPALGGTTRQVSNQARTLSQRGERVRVLARRRSTAWARRDRDGDVVVERFGWPHGGAIGEKVALPALASLLVRRRAGIRQLCVVMYPDFLVAAGLAALLRRTVMVWAGLGDATDALRHRRGILGRAQVALRQSVCRRVTHVALSEAIQDELRSLDLVSVHIPVGVNLSEFRPPSLEERTAQRRALGLAGDRPVDRSDIDGRYVVVYTGHLRRLKAVDKLLGAADILVRAGVPITVLVVGAGTGAPDSCETDLRVQAQPLVEAGSVRFTGAVPDVRPLLWAADVFVLPSTREGMPNSLVEAMACGLPCIAPSTACGAILLPDAGLVPAHNGSSALADALMELWQTPERRRDMGRAGRRVAMRWGIESVCDRYAELSGGGGAEVTRWVQAGS